MKVAIVARTAGDSYMPDAIKELQNSMAKELSTRGITAAFIPAPDGSPLTQLDVVEWDEGSRAARYFGFGGEGHILVVVNSPSADGQPGYSGSVRGFVRGGAFGGDATIAASEAGFAIAKAIATGSAE